MKWLLVAIYVANGSTKPEMRTEVFPDKESCRAVSARYVSPVMGQARAFCVRVIEG